MGESNVLQQRYKRRLPWMFWLQITMSMLYLFYFTPIWTLG